MEIYKQILEIAPRDPVALRALVEIYERQGDFAGLARTLRDQVEVAPSKQEHVSLLRRLLVIYDERLDDVDNGAWAASEILKSVPGDRDTLARLEDMLARAGDNPGLVQTLDYHAEHASTPDERIQVLARAAEILDTTLNDASGAALRWEDVARLDPDDARALDALTSIYGRLDAPADLARVLDAQIARLVGDPQQQTDFLRRLAELCESPLDDRPRARRAWEALLEILPTDAAALEALSRIYTEGEDWATLVKILDRQVPQMNDPARAAQIALRRAEILDTKLDDGKEAARALEQVISELDPRSWDRGSRRALRARPGAGAHLPGSPARRAQVDRRLRARAGDRAAGPGGAASAGAAVRVGARLGAPGQPARAAARADHGPGASAPPDPAYRRHRRATPRRAARRLRLVPPRLQRSARRRVAGAGRGRSRQARAARGADRGVRRPARTRDRADGPHRRRPQDRGAVRREAGRSGARLRGAARRAGRRSGGA